MGFKAVNLFFRVGLIGVALILLGISVLINFTYKLEPPQLIWIHYITVGAPFIVAANLTLFLMWIFKLKFRSIIPLISLILNFGFFRLIVGTNLGREGEIKGEKIVACTYNVNYFSYQKEINAPSIARMMSEKGVTLFALQEFEPNMYYNLNEIIGELDFLPYNTINIQEGNIGMAIFSKYPIVQSHRIGFENSNNGALWADIIISGDTVRVINNHLQTTGYYSSSGHGLEYVIRKMAENFTKRAHQVSVIREFIDNTPYPVIVMGDFNDTPKSYAYSKIKGDDLYDTFHKARPQLGGTYLWTFGLVRIDFIMHSKEFRTISYKMISSPLSDHKPIFSVLEYRN